MAIPNLIGVISLSGLVVKITNNYVARKIKKKTDVKPMYSAFEEIQKMQEESTEE
jgi:AGCS family alanine or glycine:cation symporter